MVCARGGGPGGARQVGANQASKCRRQPEASRLTSTTIRATTQMDKTLAPCTPTHPLRPAPAHRVVGRVLDGEDVEGHQQAVNGHQHALGAVVHLARQAASAGGRAGEQRDSGSHACHQRREGSGYLLSCARSCAQKPLPLPPPVPNSANPVPPLPARPGSQPPPGSSQPHLHCQAAVVLHVGDILVGHQLGYLAPAAAGARSAGGALAEHVQGGLWGRGGPAAVGSARRGLGGLQVCNRPSCRADWCAQPTQLKAGILCTTSGAAK